jgi:hypothetical protein
MNGNDVIRVPILQKIAESVPYTMSLSASIFGAFLVCSATSFLFSSYCDAIPAVHFRSNGLYRLTSLLTSLTLNKFGG